MNSETLGVGIRRYSRPENAKYILNEIERILGSSKELTWSPSKIKAADDSGYIVDTTFRFNVYCFLGNPALTDEAKKQAEYLTNLIDAEVVSCLEDYKREIGMSVGKREPYELLKYTENNFLEWHTDDNSSERSRVSLLYYLNDDYEGGELEFENFEGLFKPKEGDVVIFPSSFIYKHRVRKVAKGTRYVIADFMA